MAMRLKTKIGISKAEIKIHGRESNVYRLPLTVAATVIPICSHIVIWMRNAGCHKLRRYSN